jgi:hypothetical protein
MSIPALGHKSTLQICKEASYGVAPAAAIARYDIANFKWSANQSAIECPNMNSAGASTRGIIPGPMSITGSFDLCLGFGGTAAIMGDEELWRWLMSTYTSALAGGETLVTDHTYKEANQQLSYTFDLSLGNIPTGKVTQFNGVYCTGWNFSVESGLIILSASIAASAVTENKTPMTGSLTSGNTAVISHHGHLLITTGNIKDGSGLDTAIVLRRLAVKVEYPHDTGRNYAGTVWNDSPVRNGPMTARIEGQLQWDAASYIMQAKLLTNAPVAGGLKFLWQHPTTIGSTSKREFEIIALSPVAGGFDVAMDGPGVIVQNFAWALAYDTTDTSCMTIRKRTLHAALA